jgi:hypothetical protein
VTVLAGPSRARQLANFAVTQAAWFAAVLGAAHGRPDLGTLPALAAIGWHLAISARPRDEAMLALLAAVVGLAAETVVLAFGHVAYPSGQWSPLLPPYWLVALWSLFAITLNVTMRWLRGRPALAALAGAIAGPLAFSSGVRLGGASFIDPKAALATLVIEWAVLAPLLVALSTRFDGVTLRPDATPLLEPRHA